MAWNLMKIKHTRSSTYQAPAATILLANGFVRGEVEHHRMVLGFISVDIVIPQRVCFTRTKFR